MRRLPPTIKQLVEGKKGREEAVKVSGWVKHIRNHKKVSFVDVQDGSNESLQVVLRRGEASHEAFLKDCTIGSSVRVSGRYVEGKVPELQFTGGEKLGGCDVERYPLQNKDQGMEFLRSIPHLRARTDGFRSTLLAKDRIIQACHASLQEQQFTQITCPVLTSLDCEGAGSRFTVEEKAFFGDEPELTVSGQLYAEAMALGLGRVYTFGPTFRAEKSHTRFHLAEFWMLEPEMAFCTAKEVRGVANHVVHSALSAMLAEEELLHKCYAFHNQAGYEDHLASLSHIQKVLEKEVPEMTYTKALDILSSCGEVFQGGVPQWGDDLGREHELYLAKHHLGGCGYIIEHPKSLKPFYMKATPQGDTVASFDFICSGLGEVIGGSGRIDEVGELERSMDHHFPSWRTWPSHKNWYYELRQFGSAPHAGFGIGMDRLIMMILSANHIKDVVAFPSFEGNLP